MTRKDLLARVRQRPFYPFRLVVSEGAAYDIRHPEQLMVAQEHAVIGLPSPGPDQNVIETTVMVDLLHVVRVEPLGRPAPAGAPGDGAPPA